MINKEGRIRKKKRPWKIERNGTFPKRSSPSAWILLFPVRFGWFFSHGPRLSRCLQAYVLSSIFLGFTQLAVSWRYKNRESLYIYHRDMLDVSWYSTRYEFEEEPKDLMWSYDLCLPLSPCDLLVLSDFKRSLSQRRRCDKDCRSAIQTKFAIHRFAFIWRHLSLIWQKSGMKEPFKKFE